jgi:two-component system, OmpR family, response regulator VicR
MERQGFVAMTTFHPPSPARHVSRPDSVERPKRILIIGDDTSPRSIAERLRQEGFDVQSIRQDNATFGALRGFAPNLIVVDLQQPEPDGLNAVRQARDMRTVPVLIVSPPSQELDRLLNGEEYLSKPLQQSALIERVHMLIDEDEAAKEQAARTAVPPLDGDLRFDDLVIRPRLHAVERDGVPIDLSATEFDLLYFLASHPRQVFTRQQLLDRVWHYQYFGDTNTVTVHMSRLRKKVEPEPGNPTHLRTVWRVGYKFVP